IHGCAFSDMAVHLWPQAALFSAISTTFLIETSGMLKQDPNDISAAALVVISQALVAISTGNSSANPLASTPPEQGNASDFVPSRVAVIVNTLWYMSLSLSIATAFLAMLAKDWCYSFSARRTGHPRDQAHRRQRKWKLIERLGTAYGLAAPLILLGYALIVLIFLSAGLFLTLDRYLTNVFVKTMREVLEGCVSCLSAAAGLLAVIAHPIYILCSGIHACVNHVIQRLELTEDLTTSLALGWLLQHCETASAVDIALQAIAGASRDIPKEPLLSSHATEQIMRRIVSHNSSEDKSMHDLYTRSLGFLGFKSSPNSTGEKDGTAGDVNVMVWDLKSRNEREVADLIKDGSFIPTDDNLDAIKIGNSVASQSLPFLMGEAKNTTAILNPIIDLLSRHSDSKDNELHPAAVQSLANAAALYTALSTTPESPSSLAMLCMKYCERLIRKQPDDGSSGISYNLETCGSSESPHSFETAAVFILRTRVLHAIRILVESNAEATLFQKITSSIGGMSEFFHNTAQLWLLLDRVGDSATDDQRRWKLLIENNLEDNLKLQSKGFDPMRRTGNNTLKSSSRNGSRSNRPRDILRKVEGGDSLKKHQRAYTARIIQRILKTRGSQGNEDLDALIEEDFRELPPRFQRFLPILAPLPPSRETSQVSLETQIEAASAGDMTAEPAAIGTGTGHVSVTMLHPPGTPESGDH
ncbi:unnamed protein product, partial [Rhizoctonia solani]